jgi:hypothetical protein
MCACFGHSFAHYITSFIAFMHIHVDIRRITIIITWSTNRCFGFDDNASMSIKKQIYASLCTKKKGRCFSPSAQKIRVSSISKQFTHGWIGNNILQGMNKFTE